MQQLKPKSSIKQISLKDKNKALQRNVEKSLIGTLPQSVDLGQRLRQKDLQIQRLIHALQFYRGNDKNVKKSINPFEFHLNNLNNEKNQLSTINLNNRLEEYLLDSQIEELISNSGKAHSLTTQNEKLREEIKYLQKQIIQLRKIKGSGDSPLKKLNKKAEDSQIQINKLKNQIWSLETEISRINYENTELKKALNSLTKIKLGEQSVSAIQQQSESKVDSVSLDTNFKLSERRQQLQQKSLECQNLKKKNIELQVRLFQLSQRNNMNQKQKKDPHSSSPSKRKTVNQSLSAQKKHNILNSISELQMIDIQRYQLKIAQKNNQYQQLYHKYQKTESQKIALYDINEEIQRERKFLADRLSQIEIFQQGEEVVGQMENKLVLMSTQLMRLGNLNRTKLKQTQQLNIQVKDLIRKLELTTKENIEKEKIILNYKEQLTLIQQKLHEKNIIDDYDQQTLEEYKQQIVQREKEINRVKYHNKELQEDVKTYELKIKVFEEKIARLQQENKELQKQVKETEKKILSQSNNKNFNLELELERYKNSKASLQVEIKTLQSKIISLRSQLQQFESQRSSFLIQRKTYEQKISHLQSQIQKHEFKIEQKDQQLRNLKHIYQERLISKNDEIRKLSDKISIMEKNTQSLIKSSKNPIKDQNTLENLHKVGEENIILKIQISKYEERVIKMGQQIQRLNVTLTKLSNENQNLTLLIENNNPKEKQNREYKRQIDSLTNKVNRLEAEKLRHESKAKQAMEEIKRLEQFQGELRRLRNEYEVTKNLLQIKDQQYNALSKKLQTNDTNLLFPRSFLQEQNQLKNQMYQNKLKSLSEQYQRKYSSQIQQLKRQVQGHKQKIKYYEDSLDRDNLHEQLSQQISRLNAVLGQRIKDIIRLKKQVQLYQHQIQKCQEMLTHERNNKIRQIDSFESQHSFFDADKQTFLIKNQQKEIILLNERLKSLKQTNHKLEEKLDQIFSDKIKLQHEVSELEYSRGQKSMIYHQNQNYLTTLINEVKISNQRLEQSIKQIEDHYIMKIEEKQLYLRNLEIQKIDEKQSFEREVYEMRSDIRRLEVENKEKDVLLTRNQQSCTLQQSQHQNLLKIKEEYQIKLVLISQQIERCKLLIDQKNELVVTLQRKLQRGQDQKKQLLIQNLSSNNTVEILSRQIQRLSQILSHNIEEIRNSDKKINRLQVRISDLQLQNKTLKQNQGAQSQHQSIGVVSLYEHQQLIYDFSQAKNKIVSLQEQKSYLSHQLRQAQNTLQSQQRSYFKIEEEKNRLIRQKKKIVQEKDTLQNKNRELKRSYERLNQLLNDELRKKQNYEKELIQKRSQVLEYQFKEREQSSINFLRDEVRQLKESNNSLQAKFELILSQNQKLVYQVEGFKRSKSNSVSSNKNQQSIEETNQLRIQNKVLRKQIQELQQKIIENNKCKMQVQTYQEQIIHYENRLKRVVNENAQLLEESNRLQQQLKDKCQENRKCSKKINQVEDQLDHQRNNLQRARQEITTLTRENKQLQQKEEFIEKKSNIHQSTQNNPTKTSTEHSTEKIKMTSIDQVDENEQISRGPSAHQGLSQPQSFTKQTLQKFQILQTINIKLKRQNQCYRRKSIQYQFKMNKLKEEFDLLSKLTHQYREENDRLKKVVGSQAVKGQHLVSPRNTQKSDKKIIILNNQTHNINLTPSNQIQQHYHSPGRAINGTLRPQSPQRLSPRVLNQKTTNANSPTSMPRVKNGSQITSKRPQMNIKQYNELKESMHLIHDQLSIKNKQGHQSSSIAMVTIPIQQVHMLINQIERLSAENKTLIFQINEYKEAINKHQSGNVICEQRLAKFVLMIVEIQALRHRVAVVEAEREQIRRRSMSPPANYK